VGTQMKERGGHVSKNGGMAGHMDDPFRGSIPS
jgi:hypothetical protein